MTQPKSIRSIAEVMGMLQGGTFTDRCSDEMRQLTKQVEETGKPGKLTITLDFKRSAGALSIDAKVTAKVPETREVPDLFWATVEGNLSLQNPNQRNLELQDVTPVRGDLRHA